MINRSDYYTDEQWKHLLDCVDVFGSPKQYVFLDIVKQNYIDLHKNFEKAKIYYAVKSNPSDVIIKTLDKLGSNFDVASVYELDQLSRLHISPNKISYGNTIKSGKNIKEFYDYGVRLFVTDSLNDLHNIAKYAPNSKIFVRILVDELDTADWPLSKKFGCDLDMAYQILEEAIDLGLTPYGVSFHVGSQQRNISTWHAALVKVKYLFDNIYNDFNIKLRMINMGGGFPAHYLDDIEPLEKYCKIIQDYIVDVFGENYPEIILEPGRSLVGNAGVLVTDIVNISKKSHFSTDTWLYINSGKFNGLAETLGESIKYPIYCDKSGEEIPYIIAGQTCDSADILYEDFKYELPKDLKPEDKLYFLSTGAYTASYSAIGFNGFPPLKVEII